jgi:hypothetical protein
MAAFTVGPTIDPRMFANGNRTDRGVPGVTALDSLQVGSVKGLSREYLRGPATTDVAIQARMAKESFMSSSRVAGATGMEVVLQVIRMLSIPNDCQEDRMYSTRLMGIGELQQGHGRFLL